ncbi:hypothetical protein J4051_10335 [Gelidibacter sp. DF109]|uniref:Uncharacterized protein n=1 Tax=Gelidibacter pelagius TaxID=2819985 RepID=A0ABS3SSH3_9FLAO|nr:hypothetical protein [Gelidibacter pelagius]
MVALLLQNKSTGWIFSSTSLFFNVFTWFSSFLSIDILLHMTCAFLCWYGLTLSLWDYIFNTHHVPHDGRDIELGFDDEDDFPKTFVRQTMYPIKSKK